MHGVSRSHQDGTSQTPLCRRNDAGLAPPSFAQERFWFLEQINPGDLSATISRGLRLTGSLDTNLLKESFQIVVARHELLRTTFAKTELHADIDSKPMGFVVEKPSVALPLIDLSHVPQSEREDKARSMARAETARVFDLTLGSLIRTTLLRLSADDHILLLNAHRIVSDERSTDIFFQDLWGCYCALIDGQIPQLKSLPIQYADYAVWQRQWLQGDILQALLGYWQTKLQGAPAVIELPTDRPRATAETWKSSSVGLVFEKEMYAELRALSERENVTLFVTMLAAFQLLLARHSGQQDIVVGSTVPNRDRQEVQGVIGPFSDALPLRTELAGNDTFKELLKRVNTVVQEAHFHAELPFGKLLEELHLVRNLSHAPVFQVMCVLQKTTSETSSVSGLTLKPFAIETASTGLDLALLVNEEAGNLSCTAEYRTNLFNETTIERLIAHYRKLLASIVANPEGRIWGLQILPEDEREQLLIECNQTATEYPNRCLHELFEEQVERTPDSVALEFEGEQLTYSQLSRRANRLAHYLVKRGVGPEVLVGVCMERSIEMVVGLLGTLKAGGAYVPLDPEYPPERLSFMLEDAGIAVLLTQEHLLQNLPRCEAESVCLDRDWEQIAKECDQNPEINLTSDSPAYVIYTSGSTGRPKGVVVPHRAICNHMLWMQSEFPLTEEDSVLQKTPISFDASVWEFYAPLMAGARLVIARPGGHRNTAYLVEAIRRNRVTILQLVPTVLRLMLDEPGFETCNTLRRVYCGGEQLPLELVHRFTSNLKAELVNLYGPTEASIDSTYWICKLGTINQTVPIGRPIANMRTYVLDSCAQPVPIGVRGELYLGGEGLARGYLHSPELTSERFVPDPFGGQPGARLYRTGDLVRSRADGTIEYLGRRDHQVKVRGFRIELGEIEAALAEHEAVRECVVVVREYLREVKSIVAYVVLRPSDAGATYEGFTSNLRRFLKERLPDYMLPATFVFIASLPLMPNGKLDRQALPEPDGTRPDLEAAYIGPRDRIEEQLVSLWEKTLGLKSIGIRDNFFELGGHSLLAARLFAQIENRFGRSVPLATLFQGPTIEQLAHVLRETGSSGRWSSLVPIQPHGAKPPLFCIHAAGANVLIYRPLSRHLGIDQPIYALQAQGLDGQTKPYLRVEDMAAHYIREIRTLQPEGPYFLLGASSGGLVIFEMAHQLIAQGQKTALLAMLNTNCPVYSLPHRVRCHIGHLIKLGPGTYLRAAYRSISRKLGTAPATKDSDTPLDPEVQEAIDTRVDMNDPLVRTIMAILHADKNYVPYGKIYPGKICMFWARDAERDFEDNRLGWRRLAADGLEVHVVPGTHTSIREEPNVAILAEKLRSCLAPAASNC